MGPLNRIQSGMWANLSVWSDPKSPDVINREDNHFKEFLQRGSTQRYASGSILISSFIVTQYEISSEYTSPCTQGLRHQHYLLLYIVNLDCQNIK